MQPLATELAQSAKWRRCNSINQVFSAWNKDHSPNYTAKELGAIGILRAQGGGGVYLILRTGAYAGVKSSDYPPVQITPGSLKSISDYRGGNLKSISGYPLPLILPPL